MVQTLKQVLERIEQLEPAQQQAIAKDLDLVIDVYLSVSDESADAALDRLHQALQAILFDMRQNPSPHFRRFHSDKAFMRALGMNDEDIAWVEEQPIEADPGEYADADV